MSSSVTRADTSQRGLFRLLWLAIAAAVATIALKSAAWLVTGSVGLLSDAAESLVNLVAAVVALGALSWAQKPADEEHRFGHTKTEYLSAGAEGMMIFVAAVGIAIAAVNRLLHPQPIETVGLGLILSTGSSVINLVVGVLLIRAGRRHRSIILEADGKHLMTDVWTSAGVMIGVVAVAITGWAPLDPIIALVVAANIIYTGVGLLRRSLGGLMDRALPLSEQHQISQIVARHEHDDLRVTDMRTRQAGAKAFVSVGVEVPGEWTITQGHALVEQLTAELTEQLPHLVVSTHLQPSPRSAMPAARRSSHA